MIHNHKFLLRLKPKAPFTPFWNNLASQISLQLPLPNKSTVAYQHSTFVEVNHNLPTSTTINYKPKLAPISHSPDKFIIKNIKIPIKLDNQNTRNTIKQWIHTSRAIYNKGVKLMQDGAKPDFQQIRQTLVTYQHRDGTVNPLIQSWELDTPKDIRAESLRDLVKSYHTLLKRKREGSITHFQMHFKSRKRPIDSIVINKRAIKFTENGIQIFSTILKNVLLPGHRTTKKWFGKDKKLEKLWNYAFDVRLVFDGHRFWFNFPVKIERSTSHGKGIISLDPGARTFQTGFSQREVVICDESRRDLIEKWRAKLDILRSEKSHGFLRGNSFRRRYYYWRRRIEGRTTALHAETVDYLVKNYEGIFLPYFESQAMRMKSNNKRLNRELDTLQHYKFKCRLREKCDEKDVNLYLVDESWTSKTCTGCGKIKDDLGSNKMLKCASCGLVINRDINGARNILIKNLEEKFRIKLRLKEPI